MYVKARTTLSLDPCPDFMVGQASFLFHISQQFFLSLLEGGGDRNQNLDKAVFISHLKEDDKCEMDVILE